MDSISGTDNISGTDGNQLFGVEQHGIDHIPDSARTGTYRDIFGGYFGANVIFTYVVLGSVVGSLGLPLWQALLVVVAGNVLYVLVGLTALAGPRAGTGMMTVSRAAFGVVGNRFPATLSWLTATGWTAVNLVIGTLSLVALLNKAGIAESKVTTASSLVAVTAVTVVIALLGHATILRVNSALAVLLGISTAVVAVYVLPAVDAPDIGLGSSDIHWGAIMLGMTVIGAAPMSYVNTGADFSRYLPERASTTRIVASTALGGFVPSVLIGCVGVFAATAADMTDPINGLSTLLPAAVFTVYLAVVVGGTITNNFLNTYSAGMSLLATGLPLRRTIAIAFTTVLAFVAAAYVLFFEDLTDSLTAFLTLMVIWSSAWCGVFLADMALRRLHYDVIALHDSNAGIYWYRAGWNLKALTWLLIGAVASAATAQSALFTGPLVPYIGHGDLSIPTGLLVAGMGYFVHTRSTHTATSTRPSTH